MAVQWVASTAELKADQMVDHWVDWMAVHWAVHWADRLVASKAV